MWYIWALIAVLLVMLLIFVMIHNDRTVIYMTYFFKKLWCFFTRQDLVYVKKITSGQLWVKIVRKSWDPFGDTHPRTIVIQNKRLELLSDGTIREEQSYTNIKPFPVSHKWMYVSKNKRAYMTIRGEDG
jgi:hypothetical protein